MHVPVWHEKTRALVESGELHVVGIVQEQHPDRTALYAQWQGFDFPILWDPFGLAGLEVVPVVTAIDEHGIVRMPRLDPRRFEEQFVGQFMDVEFSAEGAGEGPYAFRVSDPAHGLSGSRAKARAAARAGMAHLMLGGPDTPTVDADVAALEALCVGDARGAEGAQAVDHFRSGVAHRMRYDGPSARPTDFQGAHDRWRAGLMARPNQYIWRRRIQQWGPRLDKPYAFYDWVDTACAEIEARGKTPVALRVPLSGSEVADASRELPRRADLVPEEPDPRGLVARDPGALIRIETAVALHTATPGGRVRTPAGSSRVHVTLRPRGGAHWTPDADPPTLWLELPEGWMTASPLVGFALPRKGREAEPLRTDFEISTPPVKLLPPGEGGPPPESVEVSGYAVYSICLDDGTCVFRRQELSLRLKVPPPPSRPGGDDDQAGGEGKKDARRDH